MQITPSQYGEVVMKNIDSELLLWLRIWNEINKRANRVPAVKVTPAQEADIKDAAVKKLVVESLYHCRL
ncbi:unnamed protein product [Schistocephalus solidus]|uniref:Prophage protein n=1 Tax=Schistocephalus solidus TaxID=70667 RepID=A0A183TP00_SCHSO|nr:unnamed protein product [Schistocephalus solidus]